MTRREMIGMSAASVTGALLAANSIGASPAEARGRRGHPGHGHRGRMLIKGGNVVSLDSGVGDFDKADVLVENGKIKEIRPNIHAPGAHVVNAKGMIVAPGFVDSHRHMWQGLVRNIGPDDLLMDYLDTVLYDIAEKSKPEEIYLGDLISGLSALNSGITTILDWSHIAETPEHTDAAIEGLRDSGIRGVYAYGPSFAAIVHGATTAYPGDINRIAAKYFSSSDQRLTLALAAAGPEFVTDVNDAIAEWNIARDLGVRISTHVGVGTGGAGNTLNAFADLVPGGLGDDTTYIHCCTTNDATLQRIIDTGGTFSLAIPVEQQMGHGTPPIQRILDRNSKFSLSIDVETNQPTDMFTQMHAAFATQRAPLTATGPDGLFQFGVFPPQSFRDKILDVRDVLKIATIEGAKANGLDSKIGTLTPGKEADIILLNKDAINVAPVNDSVGAIVLGMDTSNVDSVFVGGKAVKRHGKLVGVDIKKLLAKAATAQEALLARPDPTSEFYD